MEGWRTVEVAACEELPELLGPGRGPTAAELEAIRAASFTVDAVHERELVTEHDVAAFVDVLPESAGAGGAADPSRRSPPRVGAPPPPLRAGFLGEGRPPPAPPAA